MLNKRTILGMPLNWGRKTAQFIALAALLITIPVAGFAQQTTPPPVRTALSA
jgi:hypothetical protein